jgi:hypothetical protein
MRLRRTVLGLLLAFVAIGAILAVVAAGRAADWRTASREPVGLAPDPAATPEPVVQVYAARTVGWRGVFGVHTWVAVKRARATAYTVYEVIGWHLRWSDSAVVVRQRAPDARWFGNAPELLSERRGAGVDALIDRVEDAVRRYPYAGEYSPWPGPNSNTFTAWITRAVPELEVDLPPTAIGKDYLGDRVVATAPSGSGFQLSVAGLLGITLSGIEGVEINLLGLNFGINPFEPAFKLPLAGRLGPARYQAGTARIASAIDRSPSDRAMR